MKKWSAEETMDTEEESRSRRQWECKGETGVLGRSRDLRKEVWESEGTLEAENQGTGSGPDRFEL